MQKARISVEYLDHMGSDLTVVNAARASFGKESTWDKGGLGAPYPGAVYQGHKGGYLRQGDANLLRFLATGYRSGEWDELLEEIISSKDKYELTNILEHFKDKAQHWAPYAHPHLQLRMKLPIFLARQFVKHQVGGVWSEESRRYLDDGLEFWFPGEWHNRPEDIKQGSGDVVASQSFCTTTAERVTAQCEAAYNVLLAEGVAPEEARIVLPLNLMTTVVWTGSLLFWSRVCKQRVDSHAQLAAQELGHLISGIVQPYFPVSWEELVHV